MLLKDKKSLPACVETVTTFPNAAKCELQNRALLECCIEKLPGLDGATTITGFPGSFL